jgi:site-specific recombinase XerD
VLGNPRLLLAWVTEQLQNFLDKLNKDVGSSNGSKKMGKLVIQWLNDQMIGKFPMLHANYSKKICPTRFSSVFTKYIEHLEYVGKSASTINQSKHYCVDFLIWLEDHGIKHLKKVKPKDIRSALADTSLHKGKWATFCRVFLRYMNKTGLIPVDISLYVPSVKQQCPLPSIYSNEEILALLESIDRNTAVGKRNYLMASIAARYGLRASDIANLQMKDIDLIAQKFSFEQKKTHVRQSFDFLPGINEALQDYLTVRKSQGIESLFLTATAPTRGVAPAAVSIAIGRQFCNAGLKTLGKKHGPHAVQMSLATRLVEDKVPYAVVGKILGHESGESLKNYVKLDIESLRIC